MFPWLVFLKEQGRARLSDLEYLAIKEFDGKLTHELSSEFTGNAAQITITPASGKTFYHLRSRLYPVVDTINLTATNGVVNRRADVELTLDSTVIDVLTYDFESNNESSTTTNSHWGAGQTGQFESNIVESMAGDGVKTVTLTSTNTSGTYRVSLIGVLENDADSPGA